MPRGRHSLAPNTVRSRRLALVSAPLVTLIAVGVGVVTNGFDLPVAPTAESNISAAGAKVSSGTTKPQTKTSTATENRTLGTSRTAERAPLVDKRVPKATGRLWTTADLDLRVEPRESSRTVGVVEELKPVAVTGRTQGRYAEVIIGRATRWVTAEYLARTKPKPEPEEQPLSSAPCPDGSDIEAGLQPAAQKTYRAVCAAFPELTTYGGQDGHGEHVNGQAIDFMVPSADVGERLKDYLYAHRTEFDLFDIIWSQQIWTIERSGEGFRPMEDRGSPTANHEDHVHIMVN